MSTTTIQPTTATACPAWCADHLPTNDPELVAHTRRITVGEARVDIEFGPEQDGPEPVLHLGVDTISAGQNARDLAAAIVAAVGVIEGDPHSARIARNVAAILNAEPISAYTLDALATTLGVDVRDLIRNDESSAR